MKYYRILLLVFLLIITSRLDYAQSFRSLKIGRLWHTTEDGGGMDWVNSTSLAGRYPFVWPAPNQLSTPFLNRRWEVPSNSSSSGFSISIPNWVNQNGQQIPLAVYNNTTNSLYYPSIKLITRSIPPTVIVDDLVLSDPWPPSPTDEVDGSLASDQMTRLGVRTPLGVDVQQDVYAYTNRHFWDLLIYDYTFTNTGILDLDGNVTIPNQVIDSLYTEFNFRSAVTRIGHNRMQAWGEYLTHEFTEYYSPLKILFSWDGDSRDITIEDAGDPDPDTGEWLSTQYFGMAHLHADISAGDPSNDANQPLGSTWRGYSKIVDLSTTAGEKYYRQNHLSRYNRPPSWNGSGGNPTWESGNPNWHAENQVTSWLNYGPYKLNVDEDVRMTFAFVVAGMPTLLAQEYGAAYKSNPSTFSYFDPKTGPPPKKGLAAKLALLNTSRDSIFRVAEMAQWLLEHDFRCPSPPVSPSLNVQSSGGKIIIEWGDEAERTPDAITGVLDFESYKLYRSIGAWDIPLESWEMIFQGTERVFNDTEIPAGVATYYYVTAIDNGTQTLYGPNTLGLEDGEKLESSPFWNMTTKPAYKLKAPENNLTMVDVVPNPYNINAAEYQFPSEPDKILFVNLSAYCTITIYTVQGNKVTTLYHTSGSASEPWNQRTDWNQYVTSGVYIYRVVGLDENQNPNGDEAVGKFVIIR